MDFSVIIDYSFQTLALIVSIVACFYTIKTYKKSHNILDVLDSERKYRWNRKELESIFSTLSIDSIDSFFTNPTIIRDDLWKGLQAVDISSFQYIGNEKDEIVDFVKGLTAFLFLRYEQTPSKHWKFKPLLDRESYDIDKEMKEIEDLSIKVKSLKPLFDSVKSVLTKYHLDIRKMNLRAYELYDKKIREELNI